jgi:hypothetical protein
MAKKKEKKLRRCLYCTVFAEATIRRWFPDEHGNSVKERYCGKIKKYIRGLSEGCPEAVILDTNLFYCERNRHWKHIKVCVTLRLAQTEGCIHCKQGSEIAEIRRGLGTKPTLIKKGFKPILVKRNQPEEKPILIKRHTKPILIKRRNK